MLKRDCARCYKRFNVSQHNRKHCSEKCRIGAKIDRAIKLQAQKRAEANKNRKCHNCGGTFAKTPEWSRNKYCSYECVDAGKRNSHYKWWNENVRTDSQVRRVYTKKSSSDERAARRMAEKVAKVKKSIEMRKPKAPSTTCLWCKRRQGKLYHGEFCSTYCKSEHKRMQSIWDY